MVRPLFASTALFLLIAGSAVAGESFPFAGDWKITAAIGAPWADPEQALVTNYDKVYIGKVITITKNSMEGPFLGCGKTEMKVENLPFAGLFEGMLAVDPKDATVAPDEAKAARQAKELGFTTEPVPTLVHGCSELLLHRKDSSTLLFGLDNKIYEMKRQ